MKRAKQIVFIVCVLAPMLTVACPLCQGGQGISKETIFAYKGITLFLALLPILGSGGIFYWIYLKNKMAGKDE